MQDSRDGVSQNYAEAIIGSCSGRAGFGFSAVQSCLNVRRWKMILSCGLAVISLVFRRQQAASTIVKKSTKNEDTRFGVKKGRYKK